MAWLRWANVVIVTLIQFLMSRPDHPTQSQNKELFNFNSQWISDHHQKTRAMEVIMLNWVTPLCGLIFTAELRVTLSWFEEIQLSLRCEILLYYWTKSVKWCYLGIDDNCWFYIQIAIFIATYILKSLLKRLSNLTYYFFGGTVYMAWYSECGATLCVSYCMMTPWSHQTIRNTRCASTLTITCIMTHQKIVG